MTMVYLPSLTGEGLGKGLFSHQTLAFTNASIHGVTSSMRR